MPARAFPITLFVPGPWARATVLPTLGAHWTAEWIPNDGEFARAFHETALPESQHAEVERCPGALVVEGEVDLTTDPRPLVELAQALQAAGAVAVRVEQSRAGFAIGAWVEVLSLGLLVRGLIALVGDTDGVRSSGMHLFGLPDAEVDDPDGADIVDALCRYQVEEAPTLLPGHTFRPDEATPKRTLERWPDASFPQGHPCANPFGVWRMVRTSRRQATHSVVFMPSLAAQLLAAERQAGRPLDEDEVLTLRDRAACMPMEADDAQALERSRGYADLDPEQVWPQWQLLRSTLPPA